MKLEVIEKERALHGNYREMSNYNGDGFYHFNDIGVLVCIENGEIRGEIYTRLGKEPPKPRKPIKTAGALFGLE